MTRVSFFLRSPLLLLAACVLLMAAVLLPLTSDLTYGTAQGPFTVAAQGDGNTFTVADVTVVEGGTANVTVTLSSAAPSGGVSFTAAASYSTTGTGNAAATDVQSVASALTIAENSTSGNLAVRARKDTLNEGAETFTVTVTASTSGWSAASGDDAATVTIHDPVRFEPQTDDPSASRSGIGAGPESDLIYLYFKVGEAVSVQFPAAHAGTGEAPYTYALGGPERFYKRAQTRLLPSGLTFNAATRTLSGTPTGVDGSGVTTLGSNRLMNYHVWDASGENGPDGDANTDDNREDFKVRITICPADSAATADGSAACVKTAELYSLEVSHGDPATPVALSPTFDRDTGAYSATVDENVDAVDVSVLPEDLNIGGVTMTVNGEEFDTSTSGRKHTGEADLDAGANVIKVEVESGTTSAHSKDEHGALVPVTKTYTINVQRKSSDPVIQFGSATYSGTEGDTIAIQLRLDEAQSEDFRIWVRLDLSSDADYESDFSFGDCYPGEVTCDFGIGVLDVTIPAGDTTYDYNIRTIDDDQDEGSETFTLDFAYIGSPYVLGANSEAVITIADNDGPGVIVSTETVSMDEDTSGNEEADATYTIKLNSQPDDWVRVYAESAFPCKVTVLRGFVEFSRHNWDQPQKLRVRSYPDYDGVDEEVVISHRIETASRSAEYRTVTVAPVTVSVADNNPATLLVQKESLMPLIGESERYWVYLNADPSPIYGENPADCYDYTDSHTVIINAVSDDTDVATVSPSSLTFTADDYFVLKSFTVTRVGSGDVRITHTASGTDPAYTSEPLMLQSVLVTEPVINPGSAPDPPTLPQEGREPERVQRPLPGPVGEVQLTATTDSLTVNWSAPDTGAEPTRYIAHIAPVGGGKGETKNPKAKRTSVTFRGLEAGKSYRIFVRAQSQAGKGPRVKVIVTLPEAPPG